MIVKPVFERSRLINSFFFVDLENEMTTRTGPFWNYISWCWNTEPKCSFAYFTLCHFLSLLIFILFDFSFFIPFFSSFIPFFFLHSILFFLHSFLSFKPFLDECELSLCHKTAIAYREQHDGPIQKYLW